VIEKLRFRLWLYAERFRLKVWRGSWLEKRLRRSFYLRKLPAIRRVARAHGYAVGVHGSLTRDFDLIAAPWTDEAADADTLAAAVREAVGGYLRCQSAAETAHAKPCGRRAYVILTDLWPGRYVDLSVMPRGCGASACTP
jgi:hypothetical protein